MNLRASAMPRIRQCPGSALLEAHQNTSEPAEVGTVVHEMLSEMVQGRQPDIKTYARQSDMDEVELRFLYFNGVSMWRDGDTPLSGYFSAPECEVEFGEQVGLNDLLTGHADIVSPLAGNPRARIILDWKTGRLDSDYSAQLKTYAWLEYKRAGGFEHIDSVTVGTAWVRSKTVDWVTFNDEVLAAWGDQIQSVLEEAQRGILVEGPQCGHCPVVDCPIMREKALALTAPDNPPLEITPENLGEIYAMTQWVKSKLKGAEDAIKQCVNANGGAVTLEGGEYELAFNAEVRKAIKYSDDVYQMLQLASDTETVQGAIKFTKEPIMEAVKKKAGKGNGAKALRELDAELEKLNAYEETEVRKLGRRKKEKQIT